MGKPDDQMLNRGARTYLAHAVKAATHPVRREILKSLKKGPQSTVELEGELKESRYNLYHHLDVLSSAGLVKESLSKSGGKARHFALKEPKRPELAVLLFDEAELKPYLQLDQMIEAAFDCTRRLFGLTFQELSLPLHHKDAKV